MPAAAPVANSSQALGNLQAYQTQLQSPDQAIQGAETSLGVPAAQAQVSGLRQAISNTTSLLSQVAPSVYGRTSGSLVTDAQATKQVANEQAPISANLNQENAQYSDQNANLTNLESRAESRANATLTGQSNQMSYLENIYKDLYGSEQDAAKTAESKREYDTTLAENKRQFNVSAAQSAKTAAAKGPTAAQTKVSDQQSTAQYLQGKAGKDGYVSPQDFATARRTWVAAGYSAADFNGIFKNYANLSYGPTSKTNYGL